MIGFAGKCILITGAAGGIGRATAELFARLDAALVLTDRDAEAAVSLASELDPTGARAVGTGHDVTVPEEADRAVALACDRFGGLDAVVCAAGLYPEGAVETMQDEDWRRAMAVNLDGVFHTCRAAVPHLREGGSIVAIASMAGHRGSRFHAHYAAAKGGVLSFCRSLAQETAPRIRVNAVSPGLIDTPMVRPLMASRGERLIEQTPLGRLGRPDEVAGAVAFLCSDLASFITGETIHINGGLHIAS